MFALCGRSLQVDGNFGVSAAVTEMLMQSHDGVIKLLPALPDEWSEGEFKGLCARGGFELDFAWKNKQLSRLSIVSKAGEACTIEDVPGIQVLLEGKPVRLKRLPNGRVEFNTLKNKTYLVAYK